MEGHVELKVDAWWMHGGSWDAGKESLDDRDDCMWGAACCNWNAQDGSMVDLHGYNGVDGFDSYGNFDGFDSHDGSDGLWYMMD